MSAILIVDDHEQNRYLLRAMLTASGHELIEAANGAEALELARRSRPDLIISDILMPQMDGFVLCRECKRDEQLRDIPFMFYTATYTDPRDEALALQLGAARFVIKPVESEEFIAIVHEVLHEHTAGQLAAPTSALEEEKVFYRLYNEALIRKLEDKMLDLERVNRSLAVSEERFRRLAENAPDLIYRYEFTPQRGFTYVSPAATVITGYTPEEHYADPDLGSKLVHPDDRPLLEAVSHWETAPGEPLILRWVRKDGQIVWIEQRNVPVFGEAGELIALEGIARDITERKRTEEHIRYQASLIESVSDAIISTDPSFFIRSWNKAAEAIYGWKTGEVVGKLVSDVILPEYLNDDGKQVLQQFRAAGSWKGEVIQKHKDGTPLNILSSVTLIRDSAGNPTGTVAVNRNITERVQAEQRVKLQLQRLRALHTIDQAIISTFNVRVVLEVLLEQVISQLGVDAGAILLFNQHLQTLEFAAGRGFHSRTLQHAQVRLGEGHAGRAALERRTVHVANVIEAGGDLARTLLLNGETFVAYYGVPLIAKGGIKGVLEIFHRALEPDTEWLDFLETLAGQAAIAIDDAQLFDSLQHSNIKLVLAYDATIEGWSKAMDLRDKETEGHTQRVTELTVQLAQAAGMSSEEVAQVRRSALLHDIGKLGVPDHILLKTGTLTDEEWVTMRKHPQYAYDLLASIDYLRPALDIPYCHHEKWDGTGYPRGLKGEQIPPAARLFAVEDVWDALRSDRPYRAGWPEDKALEYICSQAGKHFDPHAVELFLSVLNEDTKGVG